MSEVLFVRQVAPSLEAIEDAIVAALVADPTIAAYVADVAPFQGTLEQAIQETAFRDPAMLVLFAGFDADAFGQADEQLDLEWHVIVRGRNLRSNAARQAPAATGEVGTYQMVQDALRVLAGREFELDGLGALSAAGCELLTAGANKDRSLSAYTVVFRCTAELRVVEGDDELTTMAATYTAPSSSGTFAPVVVDNLETE